MGLQNNKASRTHEAVSTQLTVMVRHIAYKDTTCILYTCMCRIPRSRHPGPSFVAIGLTSCARYSPEHARYLRRHLTLLGNFPGFAAPLGTALTLL